MMILVRFCVCLLTVNSALGCGKKGGNAEQTPQDNPSAVKNMLGDNVQTSPYDNSGYDGKNGQAASPADLKCDFSGPCCWKNSKPPYDTMEYVKASGSPDPDKFQKNFGTSSAPSGNYLLTSSDTAAGPADKAEYQSCLIPCAGDSVKVTMKHWQSQGVKLQVCEVAQSDPNTLLGCQDLPSQGPGPDTVTLPPGQNIYIAIVAYNLVANGGNVAIIQDINVDYPDCTSSTASQATSGPAATSAPPQSTSAPGPDLGECKKVACDMEQGTCQYTPGSGLGRGQSQQFQQAGPGPFKNLATGVAKSPDGSKYGAVYLKPKENAYMETQSNVFADSDKTIKFQEYKATEGIITKGCCDTPDNCPYDTGKKVEKSDFRQWYQGSFTCKQGTKKVIFYGEDTGVNEGGIGIDNIQVYDASGSQQIC